MQLFRLFEFFVGYPIKLLFSYSIISNLWTVGRLAAVGILQGSNPLSLVFDCFFSCCIISSAPRAKISFSQQPYSFLCWTKNTMCQQKTQKSILKQGYFTTFKVHFQHAMGRTNGNGLNSFGCLISSPNTSPPHCCRQAISLYPCSLAT